MPDFARFGRSQRAQSIGQAVALPTTMIVFSGMGIMITSATAISDWSWFVGFGLAGALYWALMQGRVPPSPHPGIAKADIVPPR